MRAIAIGLLGLCGVVLAALVVVYLRLESPVERPPAPLADPRVDLLEGGADAVILSAFVTGDVPRLLSGPRLQELAPQLWYDDTATGGDIIAGGVFMMFGMPPVSDLATSFKDGRPIRTYSCISVVCIGWKADPLAPWGMARFRDMGEALGPEAHKTFDYFDSYDAYRAAHAAVLADPLQMFTDAGAEVPQPGDDGTRLMIVSLPTLITSGAPGNGGEDDPAQAKELEDLAARLLQGTEGHLEAAFGAAAMTLWVQKNGVNLMDANGSRGLPDVVGFQRGLRLIVPLGDVDTVAARIKALDMPEPDLGLLDDAIARAFEAWGEDTNCLPFCGGVEARIEGWTKLDLGPEPSWTLSYWEIGAPADP